MKIFALLHAVVYLIVLDLCLSSPETSFESLGVISPTLPKPCNATDIVINRTDCLNNSVTNHGHTCKINDTNGNTSRVITCWDGVWIETHTAKHILSIPKQPMTHRLTKRSLIREIGKGIHKVLCFFFCSDPPPPNHPPIISWNMPNTIVYFADFGKSTKNVTWPAPTASDKEDGIVKVDLVSNQASGTSFSRGSHTIIYQAVDSGGLIGYKYYSFEVKVHSCKTPLQRPHNGFVQCENPERIAGSTCYYSCLDGFQLYGNTRRQCQTNGSFSGHAAQCKAMKCPRNAPNIHPSHGNLTCTDSTFEYNDVCATRCDKGYSLPSSNFKLTKCTSRGTWSTTLPSCQDAEPPEIVDCPSSIHVNADRGQTYASVNWTIPSGTDNSGGIVTITQTVGKSSGSHFDIGINEIRYIATDPTGNKSPECIFFVIVEMLQCGPPVIQNPYVVITCPNGYTFGSSCTVSCRGSYPLIGNDKMYCDRNSTNPKLTYWNWGSSTPYCKQNKCPLLTAPAHGALTCDQWMYGFQCMLHCNDHYDIPAGAGGGSVARFTGQFSCSTSSGKWSPVDTVPDCSVRRNPQKFVLPGEVYYYSGSCSDKATQEIIKAHFIQEMQRLQSDPGREGICPNSNDCNVQNVEVTCGTTRRRRKAMYTGRYRRAKQTYILLTFDIQLQWRNIENSSSVNYQHFDTLAKKLGSMIEAKASSGTFNVANSSVETSSLQFGQLDIECEQGRYPRPSTGTCASCPLGSIYDATTRKCILCPKGMYRDDDTDVTCSLCPPGTSTHTNGTINSTDCSPICKKGFYSLDGIGPCAPCSRLEYGPSTMATACEKCERGLMTNSSASTQASDCLAFDVALPGGTLLTTVGSVKNYIISFTLASWVKLPRFGDVNLHVSIGKAAQNIMMDFGQQINISLHSSSKSTGVMMKRGVWQHV
ncbi:sushi, von Willebrand factor type A, EGF and pentraxin domain-containing protein 1-like isoform X1 [Argopecten irradians]|uniref:sushi, von Willebrand factor type A, EGF and pentraxin domain-containing protein 1-like isoform X1 n=1 Tax=Argopecten irradians TaxID=31199 RepID=UPI00370FB036